jgi:hypothetical protein
LSYQADEIMTHQENIPKLELQDLSIVLAIRDLHPVMLKPDFLQGAGVIPSNWELLRASMVTKNNTQLWFKNGIKIESQPGMVSFSQVIDPDRDLEIPGIVMNYLNVLPHLAYQSVAINPGTFVSFHDRADAAHRYLTEILLCPSSWQNFDSAPLQAAINLVYTLEECQLRLAINEARLETHDREIPTIVFGGSFSYNVTSNSAAERLKNVRRVVENCPHDLDRFRELIESQFLGQVEQEPIFAIPVGAT